MRPSWLIAAVIAIVATGWILSGQLPGSDTAEAEVKPAAVEEADRPLAKVRVDRVTAEPMINDAIDWNQIRKSFPAIHQTIHGDKPLVYFDNAASSQLP